MTWALQQAWAKQEGGASITSRTVTLGATPATGNRLIAILLWYDGVNSTCSPSFADGGSHSFTITPSSPSNARATSSGVAYMASLLVPATPSATVTATFNTTGTGGLVTLWVAEYTPTSGTDGGLDSDAAGTGTAGTSINTPTLTVTQADDLCIAVAVADHIVTSVDTPWTQRQAGAGVNQFSEGIGDILARGSSVAVAMTENVSSGWDSLAGSFKFTAPGGGVTYSELEHATLRGQNRGVLLGVR